MTQTFGVKFLSCDNLGIVVGAHYRPLDSKRKVRDTKCEALTGPSHCPSVRHCRRQFPTWGFTLPRDKRSALAQSSSSTRRLILCSAVEDTSRFMTIPIFPLNVVALPAATVPLQIFEARWGRALGCVRGSLVCREMMRKKWAPMLLSHVLGDCGT